MIASAARPPFVIAALVLGVLATTVRVRALEPQPEPLPEPPIRCAEAMRQPVVPDNARYWSIDMDGDGTPELVAETEDHSQAIVVHAAGGTPIATIPLRFPGNACDSDLGIEDGRLTAHDRGGENCEETAMRRFGLRSGQLIVDN